MAAAIGSPPVAGGVALSSEPTTTRVGSADRRQAGPTPPARRWPCSSRRSPAGRASRTSPAPCRGRAGWLREHRRPETTGSCTDSVERRHAVGADGGRPLDPGLRRHRSCTVAHRDGTEPVRRLRAPSASPSCRPSTHRPRRPRGARAASNTAKRIRRQVGDRCSHPAASRTHRVRAYPSAAAGTSRRTARAPRHPTSPWSQPSELSRSSTGRAGVAIRPPEQARAVTDGRRASARLRGVIQELPCRQTVPAASSRCRNARTPRQNRRGDRSQGRVGGGV